MKSVSLTAPTFVVDDPTIEKAVAKALAWHFWIPKDRIRAHVKDGQVTLTGNVEWLFQKRGVEDAIRSIAGVHSIANEIIVEMIEPARYYPHEKSLSQGKHTKTGR